MIVSSFSTLLPSILVEQAVFSQQTVAAALQPIFGPHFDVLARISDEYLRECNKQVNAWPVLIHSVH